MGFHLNKLSERILQYLDELMSEYIFKNYTLQLKKNPLIVKSSHEMN